jgi:nitrile hydratase accessory protein
MIEPELDAEGPAAPPRANGELVFDEPWQRRLFATTMALCDAGSLSYGEFRRQLIAEIEKTAGPYWWSWQDALEHLLVARGLCGRDELASRVESFIAHSAH